MIDTMLLDNPMSDADRADIEKIRIWFDPPADFWERRRPGFWRRAQRYGYDVGRAFLEQLVAILEVFPAYFLLLAALVGGGRRTAGLDFLRSLGHVLVRFDKLVGAIVLGTPWDLTISAWLGWQLEFRGGALIEWISGFLGFLDENHVQDAKASAERAGRFLDRHEWAGSIFFVLFLWTAGIFVWVGYR